MTKVYYSFISELKSMIDVARVTKSHEFIKHLKDQGKLLRCYTQNIDCLESRLDLTCGSKGDVVLLHGSLGNVACTICKNKYVFSEEFKITYSTGQAPHCHACTQKNELRVASNKRAISVGVLRPDIVLYNQSNNNSKGLFALALSIALLSLALTFLI